MPSLPASLAAVGGAFWRRSTDSYYGSGHANNTVRRISLSDARGALSAAVVLRVFRLAQDASSGNVVAWLPLGS